MSKKPAPLTGALFQRKGEAAPATIAPQILPVSTAKVSTKRTAVTVKLDATMYERLRVFAFKHNKSHQEVLVDALQLFLKNEPAG